MVPRKTSSKVIFLCVLFTMLCFLTPSSSRKDVLEEVFDDTHESLHALFGSQKLSHVRYNYISKESRRKGHASNNLFSGWLRQHQFHNNNNHCEDDTSRVLVCTFDQAKGFAAVFQDQLFCFQAAIALGRAYVWDGPVGSYTDHTDRCTHFPNGHECLYQPLTKCTSRYVAKHAAEGGTAALVSVVTDLNAAVLDHLNGPDASILRITPFACRKWLSTRDYHWPLSAVPEQYQHLGITWYTGALLTFMMQPNYDLLTHVNHIYPYASLDRATTAVISIHIRRGDKAREQGLMYPVNAFLQAALLIRTHDKRATHVFLCSDDTHAQQEARVSFEQAGFTFETIHYQQLYELSTVTQQNQRDKEEQYVATVAIASDIEMLSRGDYFIGTCTSGISRTAMARIVYRTFGEIDKATTTTEQRDRFPPLHIEPFTRCIADGWNPTTKNGLWMETPVPFEPLLVKPRK